MHDPIFLGSKICSKRKYGEVTFKVENRVASNTRSITDEVDTFVSTVGCVGLGDNWRSINQNDAWKLVTRILHTDLAYDYPMMSLELAEELAIAWLDLYCSNALFFTNGSFHQLSGNASWSPITSATFDTGVVCMDDNHIGILWVQDED